MLHSFPRNYREALAMLYLQQQDLKGKSPTDIYTMYLDAFEEIDNIAEHDLLTDPIF